MAEIDRNRGPVRVLGVGNVLLGDDALGPYAVRLLEARYEFPEAVEVLDVGTPGLDFTPYLSDARAVIVIDTVRSDGDPGSLRLYRMADLLATAPPPRTNPHEPGLREALMATELTDSAPAELLVVGVIPASTETGTGLSPEAQGALDHVLAAVVEELDRLGLPPTRRESPADLDIWWERPLPETVP